LPEERHGKVVCTGCSQNSDASTTQGPATIATPPPK
jgi:hypothetical protein